MKDSHSHVLSSCLLALIIGAVTLSPLESQARNAPRGPDFDGDGYDDTAIGVSYDDETTSSGGSVNLLYGSSTGPEAPNMITLRWDQDTPGVLGTQESGDRFGSALAYGDFDRDGYDDLLVGVPGEDIGSLNAAGLVNVLYGSSAGLTASGDQYWYGNSSGITSYGSTSWDQLGYAVAAGDFDGDGYDDVAITAPGYDVSSVSTGGVLILYGSSSGLTATGHQMLHQGTSGMAGDGNQQGDGWGGSLVTGDFDCDGYEDLAVGAWGEEITGYSGQSHGAVTVIYGSGSGLSTSGSQWWHQGSTNIEGVVESGDAFGRSLAAGNFDGDSSSGRDCVDLAIGAPQETVGSESASGAVNIIYGGVSGLSSSGDQILYQGNGLAGSVTAGGEIGAALTVGRFNSDSYDDLGVGANEASPGNNDETGEIYLTKGSGSGLTSSGSVRWDQRTTDVPGIREVDDHWSFAFSFAQFEGSGNSYLLVGAIGEDSWQGALSTIELDSSSSSFDALGGVQWKQDDIEGTNVNNNRMGFALPAPRLKARALF